jgi:Linalool dehydratase/isomerase
MHDLVYGGSVADEVTRSYEQAWKEFGRIGDNGHYHIMMSQDTRVVRQNIGKVAWVDAWCGALLNMWNRDFVHTHYPRQIRGLIKQGKEGRLFINVAPRPLVMGQTIVSDDCDFGWVAAWASEMGDTETLTGLLAHADAFMSPTWRNGGLYYPRNDQFDDGHDNRTLLDPMSGNVLLGYARLNVPDGLHHFYNGPWSASHFNEPCLAEVSPHLDVGQAVFDEAARTLRFQLQRNAAASGDGMVKLANVASREPWVLHCDGEELGRWRDGALIPAAGSSMRLVKDGLMLHCPDGPPRAFAMVFGEA